MKDARFRKINNVMAEVKRRLQEEELRFVGHARERLQQRKVAWQEVKEALMSGYHEKSKDVYKNEHNAWNYSIKGRTIDKRHLRIVVSFYRVNMLIITVIDLDK